MWINPASYTYKKTIRYTDRQAQGSPGLSSEFNRVGKQEISMELVFDATGVIPPPAGQSTSANGVADAIAKFTALVASVNGTIHSPNYLVLGWAQLQFGCVLTSLSISYTLFMPDGTPLRAKAAVTFQSFASETELEQDANETSPDLTHLVTVTAGDTLPLLCHKIYGDSGYYLWIADQNKLTGFRNLPPGTQLVFPPLPVAPA